MGMRSLLVLVLVAAGLGAVLWFTDEKPPVQKVAETSVLGGRSLMTCKRLRWQYPNRPPVELTRGPDGFQITEPIADVVSAAYLRNIIATWDSAQMQASPLEDTAENRAKVGLSPPELTVHFEYEDGATIEVEVGGVGPLSDKETRYLRVAGRLWVGSNALYESMRVGLDDLREHMVFRNQVLDLAELRVDHRLPSGTRETLHLKIVDGKWRLLAPVKGRADPVAATQFVTGVLALRVSWFAPGVVKLPEGEPTVVIDVHGSRGPETLRLWEQGGQLMGVLPGRKIVFASDNQQYSSIFADGTDRLRARILVPMGEGGSFQELVELVVDPGEGRGERLRLSRPSPSAAWRLVEPVEMAASLTACNEAAHALQMLVVAQFVDEQGGTRPRANDARYGLVAGAGRLAVTTKRLGETGTTTLWFGARVERPEQPLAYACRADEPDTVVLVQQPYVDALARPWLAYCDLRVLQQNATVEQLELEHADGRKLTFHNDDPAWKRDGLHELANDDLRDLRGTRAVDVRGAEFTKPQWTLRLKRRNGDELGVLRVWDRGAGEPLVMQGAGPAAVAFEVKDRTSKGVRDLWQ